MPLQQAWEQNLLFTCSLLVSGSPFFFVYIYKASVQKKTHSGVAHVIKGKGPAEKRVVEG